MELKELLGEELFQQVEEKIDDGVELFIASENDGDYIPRQDFNKRISSKDTEIDNLKSQLTERDNQIDQLKKDTNASEELQQKIEELQEQNKQTQQELETKLSQQRLESEVEKALLKNNARNPQAVKALLDLETVKVDGEEVKGLEQQLEQLQESDPYLFEEGNGRSNSGGSDGFTGDGKTPLTREAIEQMSHEEIIEREDEVNKFLENHG